MITRKLSDRPPLTTDLVDVPPIVQADNGHQPKKEGGGGASGAIALTIAIVVLIAISLYVVIAMRGRRIAHTASEVASRTATVGRGAIVQTVDVTASAPVRHIDLQGEARPFATVTLYAKISGYLKTIRVDVGDTVSANEVVATIESPETDRALAGAQADYEIKKATAGRVAQLLDRKYISPQEADVAKADAAVAEQRVAALSEEQAYETLRAPFAGRVTARFADPGALMQSAASAQTGALPVVTVAETDSLRILTYLDQGPAALVHPGDRVAITMTERPGVTIIGTVSRQSGQLDAKTRMMLVEVDVSDRRGEIVPGSFVHMLLDVPVAAELQAPVEALTVRHGENLVAVIALDSTVHFKPVTILSNDGKVVVFGSGVSLHDRLAVNLPDGVVDGARVQIDSSTSGPKSSGG